MWTHGHVDTMVWRHQYMDMGGCMDGRMGRWTHMGRWTDGHGWVYGWADGHSWVEWVDGQTGTAGRNGQTDTDRCRDGVMLMGTSGKMHWNEGCAGTDRHRRVGMDRQTDGRTDRWMDGQGQTGGTEMQAQGQMDTQDADGQMGAHGCSGTDGYKDSQGQMDTGTDGHKHAQGQKRTRKDAEGHG